MFSIFRIFNITFMDNQGFWLVYSAEKDSVPKRREIVGHVEPSK